MKNYICYFLMLAGIVIAMPAFSADNHYVVYVDGGSSGSRLHLFRYTESSMPVIEDIFSESVEPGLSSYADHPNAAGDSLKKLLDDTTTFLSKTGISPKNVTVNVLATAGMRLLPKEKQSAIYSSVKSYLRNYYAFSLGKIETISGRMEGLYDWLDVNYLLENIQKNQKTVGSIDMGGASTQIAFLTHNQSKPDDILTFIINAQKYTVFSKSFLGLGQDEARNNMNKDPLAASCYPSNYLFSSGTGNFKMTSCSNAYTHIIQDEKVKQQIIPLPSQPFIAYSGIYFTYNFFNTEKTPDQYSFEARIQNVCNRTWAQLKSDYPQVPEKYLSTYCANGVYQDQLIYNAYGISGSSLLVAHKIHGIGINWPLGAVLYALTQ